MSHIRVVEEGPVGAEPSLVYRLLADYRQHHPRFLPPAFSDFAVEEGGFGAGTVMTFRLRLSGRSYPARFVAREPEPGRVLEESDGRVTTRFTVSPEGSHSRVRIATEYDSPGPRGLVERLVAPRLLGRLYREELILLDAYARQQAAQAGATAPAPSGGGSS